MKLRVSLQFENRFFTSLVGEEEDGGWRTWSQKKTSRHTNTSTTTNINNTRFFFFEMRLLRLCSRHLEDDISEVSRLITNRSSDGDNDAVLSTIRRFHLQRCVISFLGKTSSSSFFKLVYTGLSCWSWR